jgi:hypothetical protein
MLEYDLGILDDKKQAVASIVNKLFDRHIFQTLRTQMQVCLYLLRQAAACCI